MGQNNLEERLINFAVSIISIAEKIKKSYAGNDLSTQLIRSSTSSAQNYAEAQSSESRKDFLHKIKIVLKELRETRVSLIIVQKTELYPDDDNIKSAIKESNELIAIFVTSTVTARKNMEHENKLRIPAKKQT
ncbi:MAG TPA: four helix bundle protein [Saprospiraceae bacterium]|nr:four helix bundle protein [Saprospiraceae bacterium]